jgi:hypothetical protein
MGLLGPPKEMKTLLRPYPTVNFLRIQNPEVRIWHGAQRPPSSEFWLLDS